MVHQPGMVSDGEARVGYPPARRGARRDKLEFKMNSEPVNPKQLAGFKTWTGLPHLTATCEMSPPWGLNPPTFTASVCHTLGPSVTHQGREGYDTKPVPVGREGVA